VVFLTHSEINHLLETKPARKRSGEVTKKLELAHTGVKRMARLWHRQDRKCSRRRFDLGRVARHNLPVAIALHPDVGKPQPQVPALASAKQAHINAVFMLT
jgi:hypothetical protein